MVSSVGISLASSGAIKNPAPTRASGQTVSEPKESRIEVLTRQVREGSYKVDVDSLSKKIAEELI